MTSRKFVVITTIQDATPAVEGFVGLDDWTTVIVGDRKTPASWKSREDVVYLDIDTQHELFPEVAAKLPLDHYSRKNLGYLYAMSQEASVIAESDDDNQPLAGWGSMAELSGNYPTVVGPGAPNVYSYFTDTQIWPRGFPIERILDGGPLEVENHHQDAVVIDQQLVDGEPDVDAVYRLLVNHPARFQERPPVAIDEGVFAPFNSQNTFWRPPAFPFLYLPSTVTFRSTDILRGWVAQRCIWMLGGRLAFSAASVCQDRNAHDLLADFESEVPLYVRTNTVLDALADVPGSDSPAEALTSCYRALADCGFTLDAEMSLLEAWVQAVEELGTDQLLSSAP